MGHRQNQCRSPQECLRRQHGEGRKDDEIPGIELDTGDADRHKQQRRPDLNHGDTRDPQPRRLNEFIDEEAKKAQYQHGFQRGCPSGDEMRHRSEHTSAKAKQRRRKRMERAAALGGLEKEQLVFESSISGPVRNHRQ